MLILFWQNIFVSDIGSYIYGPIFFGHPVLLSSITEQFA